MTRAELFEDADLVAYVPRGAIFVDWPHDAASPSDRLFYGSCNECGWHDTSDHITQVVAEEALDEHAKKHEETT